MVWICQRTDVRIDFVKGGETTGCIAPRGRVTSLMVLEVF